MLTLRAEALCNSPWGIEFMMSNNLAAQALPEVPNRSVLIQQALQAAMSAAYGLHPLNEQETNQLIGELVKAKLLTAEQSYLFKDKLYDRQAFQRYIEKKTREAIERKAFEASRPAAQA